MRNIPSDFSICSLSFFFFVNFLSLQVKQAKHTMVDRAEESITLILGEKCSNLHVCYVCSGRVSVSKLC